MKVTLVCPEAIMAVLNHSICLKCAYQQETAFLSTDMVVGQRKPTSTRFHWQACCRARKDLVVLRREKCDVV